MEKINKQLENVSVDTSSHNWDISSKSHIFSVLLNDMVLSTHSSYESAYNAFIFACLVATDDDLCYITDEKGVRYDEW